MSFLAPWMLVLGAVAAVPMLLHLLRRRIGARVEFPAARYLARAEREHSRTLRLRNRALMLLRMAAIVLIALAAARPVTRMFGGGHGPTAFAVVLDNSLSTTVVESGAPLFTQLDSLARRAFAAAHATDRLWLLTADGEVRTGSSAELQTAASRVTPLGGAGDPAAALSRAAALVRNAGLPSAQVALLTDAQKTSWTSSPATGSVPVIAWVPDSAPPANGAVTSVIPEPVRWTPRGTMNAQVQSPDSANYRITMDGRTLASGTVAPNGSVLVHAAPAGRGWLSGAVELEPDELTGDDIRYFAVWVGAAPRVQAFAGAGPFVASALGVLSASGQAAAGSDVHIVSADELTTLPALIVPPADPVKLSAANRALARAGVPWQFGAQRRDTVTADGADLGSPRVTLRYALQPAAGAQHTDTLARTGAEPWIVAGVNYVIVASPLTPNATNFPVTAAFVPWLTDVLADRLSGAPGRAIAASPGARLAWPTWADSLAGVDAAAARGSGAFLAPAQAGTYYFFDSGRRVGALVVNPEARESALGRWSASGFAHLLGGSAQVLTDGHWEHRLFADSTRGPATAPLLIALLCVLILEGLMTAPRAEGHL